MKTIHIKGYANEIDLSEELSDNYGLDWSFFFDEATIDTIDNVFFRFYESDEPCTLEEAVEGFVSKLFGILEGTGEEYGYSEYTTEGFNVHLLKLGGHDLDKIIKSKGNKYLHILIDVLPPKK